MTPGQSRRLARKSAMLQAEVLEELQALAKSVVRAETGIVELKDQMEAVNAKHQVRQTTEDDVAYLEDLLRCARKKLAWEKQMQGLSKRTPELLEKVSAAMNDVHFPPSDQTRAAVLQLLQNIQEVMGRLEKAKVC